VCVSVGRGVCQLSGARFDTPPFDTRLVIEAPWLVNRGHGASLRLPLGAQVDRRATQIQQLQATYDTLVQQHEAALGESKWPVVELPWSQLTSECQRY
jgi:hypothetical protein